MTARGGRCFTRLRALVVVLAVPVVLGACSDDPSPVAPPVATRATTASPPPTVTASARASRVSRRPLSRYERHPAVRALRTHYVGLARSVNLQTPDVPELVSTSTPARRALNRRITQVDYGLYYPGPVPFTPVAMRAVDADTRLVRLCVLGEGWGQDPNTGDPVNPRAVRAVLATMVRVRSAWLVDHIAETRASCRGVTIREVTWW